MMRRSGEATVAAPGSIQRMLERERVNMPWFRKSRISDDPDVVFAYDAQELLSAQQQALAGARRAWAVPGSEDPRGPDFAPIAGVSVGQYAEICRDVHATPDGDIKMKAIALGHGVAPEHWAQAFDGWNERLMRNVAVAQAFTDAYRAG